MKYTQNLLFFSCLFLLAIFACKTQKEQPHRYVDYQPYFDNTKKIYVRTPSSEAAKLDTSVQIFSNLRDEVFEFKDTVSFTQELEFSSGELNIDVAEINEKPPIFDTFMVVTGFLFQNELVNTLFPVIPDSVKFALAKLADTLPPYLTPYLFNVDHPLFSDSLSFIIAADTGFYPIKVPPAKKEYYTRNEILADTTRDLFDADAILSGLLADIPWRRGDSIPYFRGFSKYQMDSALLLLTDTVYIEIFDTSRVVKQFPSQRLIREVTEKSTVSDLFIHNDKVVFKVFYKNEEDIFLDMVKVQGGSFKIGNNELDEDERPQYGLNLSSFLLGKYEMTNKIFCAFMNYIHCDSLGKINRLKVINLKPLNARIKRDAATGRFFVLKEYENYPVVNVSWAGASLFCKTMGGSLPSEAEWEYAARGGVYAVRYYTNEKKSDYDYELRFAGGNTMDEVGWFVDNSDGACHHVGDLKPNQLGLYDMSGNVWEWCYDNYNKDFYKRNDHGTDPICLTGSGKRVNRGGSWSSDAQYCRVSNRNYLDEFSYNPYIGFRYRRDLNK
jgi:formylglycine-generating enzyme required for sulfatase activity